MAMDFDFLNYVTSTKLKKDNNNLFGCAVKITQDINQTYG